MIYCVEDDSAVRDLMVYTLNSSGFDTKGFLTGKEMFSALKTTRPELVILDIMLPGDDGLEILRKLRGQPDTSDIPVIMLTARDAVMDKVAGLDQGADDYITKPFAIEELLARIRLVLRRRSYHNIENTASAPVDILRCGELTLSESHHEVKYAGNEIELTGREFDLLNTLLINKNIVLSREQLLGKVWGYDYMGETNVVDVYIRYLRSKIDEVFGISLIQTVRGVGYVIRDDNEQ